MVTYIAVIIISLIIWKITITVRIKGMDIRLLMIVPFAVLLIFTSNNPDYQTYKISFDTGYGPYFETGIKYVAEFLSLFGLKYYYIFLILVIALTFYTFRLWSKKIENIQAVIFLYELFGIYYDVIQIRFLISMLFIFISLYFAIERKLLPAVANGIAAIFFHRLSVLSNLFIVYIFIKQNTKDHAINKKEIVGFGCFGAVGIGLSGWAVGIIAQEVSFFQRVLLYLSNKKSYDSLIIWAGYECLLLVIIYFGGYKELIFNNTVDIKIKDAASKLYRFLLFGIVVSGILLYVQEFNRLYRQFYLVGYMLYGMIERYMGNINRKILFLLIGSINIIFMIVAMIRGINFDLYW